MSEAQKGLIVLRYRDSLSKDQHAKIQEAVNRGLAEAGYVAAVFDEGRKWEMEVVSHPAAARVPPRPLTPNPGKVTY